MTNPILTSVILTYNHEKDIERCINSMLEQKTSHPYVIHIYDDCSTDNNAKICQDYANKHPDIIKFFPQKENTFLKPYNQTQAYKAMQGINTKYFCIIEGDDYWCNENKLQMAIDFLENNTDYIGWAHDTLQIDEIDSTQKSWVNELAKYEINNPVEFDDKFIFLMTSSRIFRTSGFKELNIWPVDYLVYNYHLSKGKLYYHDEIMAAYIYSTNGVVKTMGNDFRYMNSMFSYKVSKILDFKFDDLCTKMQKNYDNPNGLNHYKTLPIFKKIFGIKLGWKIWFFLNFVPKWGLESMDTNYVFPRKFVKKNYGKVKELSKKDKKQKKQRLFLIISLVLLIQLNITTLYCGF